MPDLARLLKWEVQLVGDDPTAYDYKLVALKFVDSSIVTNVGNSIGGDYDEAMMEDLATELGIALE